MIEWFTFAMQIVLLPILGFNLWRATETLKRTRETKVLIEKYMREIEWLQYRVSTLEQTQAKPKL